VLFGFERNPSMSPREVRRYMRLRLGLWLIVLLSSGSVLGYFAYRRWEDLGDDLPWDGVEKADSLWGNSTDLSLDKIRKAVASLEDDEKRAAIERELQGIAPDSAQAHYLRGWIAQLQEESQWEDAITAFRNASVADPNAMLPHYQLGLLYREHDHLEMAIAELETAVSLNPSFAEAHFALGSCFHQRGDKESAITCYDLAIRIDPVQAPYYYNLGLAQQQQGRLMDATSSYTRCIQLDPSLADSYMNLGKIQELLGHQEEAARMYRIYLDRSEGGKERDDIERKLQQFARNQAVSP